MSQRHRAELEEALHSMHQRLRNTGITSNEFLLTAAQLRSLIVSRTSVATLNDARTTRDPCNCDICAPHLWIVPRIRLRPRLRAFRRFTRITLAHLARDVAWVWRRERAMRKFRQGNP